MKNGLFGTLVGSTLFLLFAYPAGAQEKFNITAGIGLPEMLNVGLRIQFDETQIGISAGTDPGTSEDNFTLSGDFYYHFGGRSQYTSLRPWFLKTGLSYMQSEDEWTKNTTLLLVPRAGREFNLSPRFGIALEAGILFILMDDEQTKKTREPAFFDFNLDFAGIVLPSAAVNLFYRF